jgi:Fe-S-cluster containining protein
MQDLALIKNGTLEKRNLYAIRRGELVNDTINGGLTLTPRELIKIRERDGEGGGCIYYDEAGRACEIYEQRPAQCAALNCWDTTEILKVYQGPKPVRNDIIEDRILLGVIEEHEKRCGYSTLEGYVKRIEADGEKAVEKILELLRFDYHLRPFISEKLGLNPEETDLFFGRSLIETIPMFGLKVTREPDGTFSLTTIDSV